MTPAAPASRSIPTIPLGSARFRLIIAMALLIMVGFGFTIPALPQFVEELGHREAGIAAVVFAFSLTRLLGDLFTGSLIDRYGERAMTAAGAVIVGISSIAAGIAPTFGALVVLRGLGGFGSAFFLGGLMAYLVGATRMEERGRAMSVFQASFGIGFLIGPAAGGLILMVAGPRVPFFAYGGVLLACVPLILRAIAPVKIPSDALAEPSSFPEGPPPAPRGHTVRTLRPLFRHGAYRAALATSALMFLVSSAQITILPQFWTDVVGASDGSSGVPFAVASALSLLVVWHAGVVTDRRGRRSALVPALAVTAVATVVLGYTRDPWLVLGLMAVLGAASGYMRPGPSAIIGDVSSPATRGVAVAGYRFAGDAGALIGPLIAGPLAQYVSYSAAFAVTGATAALVFVVAALAPETLERAD